MRQAWPRLLCGGRTLLMGTITCHGVTQLLQLCLLGLRFKTLSSFTSANVDKASSIHNLPDVFALHRPPLDLNQTFWYKLLTLEGDCTVAATHETHGSSLTAVHFHAHPDLNFSEAPCSGRAHRTPVWEKVILFC